MKILNLKGNQCVILDLTFSSNGKMVDKLCDFNGWTKDQVKLLVRKLMKHEFIHLNEVYRTRVNVHIDDIGNNLMCVETYHKNYLYDRTMELKEFKKL